MIFLSLIFLSKSDCTKLQVKCLQFDTIISARYQTLVISSQVQNKQMSHLMKTSRDQVQSFTQFFHSSTLDFLLARHGVFNMLGGSF